MPPKVSSLWNLEKNDDFWICRSSTDRFCGSSKKENNTDWFSQKNGGLFFFLRFSCLHNIYIYIQWFTRYLTVVVHISEYVWNFLRKPDSDEEAFKFGLFNYILAACGAATGYMQLKFNVISNLEVKRLWRKQPHQKEQVVYINIYVYCIYMYTWTWDDLGW